MASSSTIRILTCSSQIAIRRDTDSRSTADAFGQFRESFQSYVTEGALSCGVPALPNLVSVSTWPAGCVARPAGENHKQARSLNQSTMNLTNRLGGVPVTSLTLRLVHAKFTRFTLPHCCCAVWRLDASICG